jgi:hypothetical protein
VRQRLPAMQIASGRTVADLSSIRENSGHFDGKLSESKHRFYKRSVVKLLDVGTEADLEAKSKKIILTTVCSF